MHKQEDITSPDRLSVRMAANKQSSQDFDSWCAAQWPSDIPGKQILDLGCGTGKQVHLFAPLLPRDAQIHACDLSPDSLTQLSAAYKGKPSLHTTACSFDELPPSFQPQQFGLVHSAYALYYTQNLPALLARVAELLLPGGIFWFIGPAPGNNRAFLDILEQHYPTDAFLRHVSEGFAVDVKTEMEKWGMETVREERLENTVSYNSPAAFMDYLKNTLYYKEGFDGPVLEALEAVVEPNGSFKVAKCVASLQFRKPAAAQSQNV